MAKKLKVIRFFIVALIIIVSQTNLVRAAPIEETILKVGYIPNSGFVEEDWSGHYSGYGYEYMESLATYGNWKFEYIPYKTWLELGEALRNGDIDLMPCMPGDYRIFRNATRTEHVIGRFPMELVISDAGVKPDMRLGTLPTNYPTPTLPSIAEDEGFNYELISYGNHHEMLDAFNRAEIDGYIDAMIDSKRKRNIFAVFDRQSYRILVDSKRTELLDQLNKSMDLMLLDQPHIRDRLNNKYLRNEGFPLTLNRQEREYLNEHKKLTVAVLNDQKPYSYFDDGKVKGALPEILKRIADDLNVEIEVVAVMDYKESIQYLQEGKFDFLADAIDDFSWANQNNLYLTQPYIKLDYVGVKRQDFQGEPQKVACVKDTLYTKTYVEPRFPQEKRLYVNTIREAFRAVSNGEADMVFVPRNQVIYYIEDTDTYNLSVSTENFFSTSLCIGIDKNSNPSLWHILNKEINHLDFDFIHAAINRNQTSKIHFSPKWFIYHHPTETIIFIVIISWIIGGIILYRNHLRHEHVKIIQHMAYTDARYNLPNLAWLESEMPQFLYKIRTEKSTKNIYIVVFGMESKSSIVAQYGEDLLIKHMQNSSKQLNEKTWVEMTATGLAASNLICVCQAESDMQIIEYVTETLPEYSYIETKDSKIWLHMKAGICEYKLNDLSVRQIAEKANVARLNNSNQDVQIFNDKMQENLTLQNQIESHMEKALADGEFKAWYQPKYDIKTRRIIGAEALVRWTSSEMGFMPPGKFIPLFEQNGFVIPVDYSILEQVFQLQKQRLAEGKEVVPISVNQSRLHITEEGYLDKIKAIIDKYKLSPTGLIELELTETVFGDFDQNTNQKRAAEIIGKLHEMGFTISVDDFGSGYSSFMMLNHLPMDVMKIDRSLLDASGDSQRMKNILANVIELGHTLNMQVICEGIETHEQEKLLLELGCNYGQGFLNAKPMPLNDFIAFFEKRNSEVA